ncbi:MAG TPA: polysaccharide deacetylase family protein [Candidatus Binatia bacterium]|nr:polysaccharide deacetylase family protein [Candidatus Binatia bacterium]
MRDRTLNAATLMTARPRGEEWRRRLIEHPRAITVLHFLMRHSPFGEVFDGVKTHVPAVTLTYDDGPNPPHTQAVLDVLNRHGVRATFFMIGRNIASHPDAAREVVARGHAAGNHSYWHSPLVLRTPSFVRAQIAATDALLRSLGANGEIHFRSPYGRHLFAVAFVLARQKRKSILGHVGGDDWMTQDPDCIAQRVVARVTPGAIILLHDGGGPRDGTAVATGLIIEQLRRRGYAFVSIDELLALDRTHAGPHTR